MSHIKEDMFQQGRHKTLASLLQVLWNNWVLKTYLFTEIPNYYQRKEDNVFCKTILAFFKVALYLGDWHLFVYVRWYLNCFFTFYFKWQINMNIVFSQIKVSWASHILAYRRNIIVKIVLTSLSFYYPDKLATLPIK